MRRAIAADFAAISETRTVRVTVTLDSRLPADPGLSTVERIDAGELPERLRQLARSADFTVLIAPETMGVLAQLTHALQEHGTRLLGSTAEAIELTGDKARLGDWLKRAGINTPCTRTVIPAAGLPPDAEYPAVLKPVDGAGSLNTFLVEGPNSVPLDAMAMPRAVLQPFVAGMPMSASFLVGEDGAAYLIGTGAQRMAIRNGRFEYLGGTLPVSCPGALAQIKPAVASIAGLRGFVGIDFVWDFERRRATMLEINPRPTTSYVGLSRLLGLGTLARAWLDLYDTDGPDSATASSLAECVHRHEPISFDVDGTFLAEGLRDGPGRSPLLTDRELVR